MDLLDILELLNNNKYFIKEYDAIIDETYYTRKIKITHKKKVISINDELVYNPDPFVDCYYNSNSHIDKYCRFFLTIVKEWFSTKIYINVMINPTYNINFGFKSYSASVYNIDVDCIYDYLIGIEYQINNLLKINTVVASNQYVCSICKSKIIM